MTWHYNASIGAIRETLRRCSSRVANHPPRASNHNRWNEHHTFGTWAYTHDPPVYTTFAAQGSHSAPHHSGVVRWAQCSETWKPMLPVSFLCPLEVSLVRSD